MRVLIDIADLGRGGAERQVVQLAAGLTRRGHHCLLAVNKTVTAYEDELDAGGVKVVAFGRNGRYDPLIVPDLVGLMRRFAPDVVVAVAFNATLFARVAAVIARRRCITAEHSTGTRTRPEVHASNKLLAPFTRRTVACGHGQIPWLVVNGNDPRKIVVIHNGVDPDEYHPDPEAARRFRDEVGLPQEALVVGLVAAHRREKRHDRFIRLIEGLRASGLDVWGCMVGGGPLLEANRGLAEGSPAADRLLVTGPRSDMRGVYSGLDLLVLVSDSVETFPLSFLEAQACARPVAGMEIGAVAETFTSQSGVLVGQGDEERLLREVTRLLKDEDRLRAMGACGRSWVEESLTVEHMVTQYERLLETVAEEGPARCGIGPS